MLSVCLVGGPPWGFRLAQAEGHSPHVSVVLPDGRADVEGLRVGDVVEAINGEECRDSVEAYKKLRATSGLLRLRLKRNAQTCTPCLSTVQSPLTVASAPATSNGFHYHRQEFTKSPIFSSLNRPYTGGSRGSALEKRKFFEDIASRQLAPKQPKIRLFADVETCDQTTDISGYDSVGGDFAGPLLSTTTAGSYSERLTPLSSVDTTHDDDWSVQWPSSPTKRMSPEDDLLRLGLLPSLVQLSSPPVVVGVTSAAPAPLESQEMISVAPPPPPPPPPQQQARMPSATPQWKMKTTDVPTGGAEGSVEIPDRQSVAQLRDQIATKLEVKTPSGARPMTAVVHNQPPSGIMQRTCITPVPFERAVLSNGVHSATSDEFSRGGYELEKEPSPLSYNNHSATLSRSNSRVFSPVMHHASLMTPNDKPTKGVAGLVQPESMVHVFSTDQGGKSVREESWTTTSPSPWGGGQTTHTHHHYVEDVDSEPPPLTNGNSQLPNGFISSLARWDTPFTEQSPWYREMFKRIHSAQDPGFSQMRLTGREPSPGPFTHGPRPWTPQETNGTHSSSVSYSDNSRRSKSVGRMEQVVPIRRDDSEIVDRWTEQKRQLMTPTPRTNGYASAPHFHLPSYRFVHEDSRPIWCEANHCMRCGLSRPGCSSDWFHCESAYSSAVFDEKSARERAIRLRLLENVKRRQIELRLADTANELQVEIDRLGKFASISSPQLSNCSTDDITNCRDTNCQLDPQPSTSAYSRDAESFALNREIAELKRQTHDDMLKKQKFEKLNDELNDQKNRRHGYIPNATPALQNNFDRFEGLINEYDRSATPSSRRSATAQPVQTCTALYRFDGMSARELSFNRGDVIRVHRQVDGNWIEGERNGQSGIFPSNYVQMEDPVTGDSVKALFPFYARNRNELSLKKGELIHKLRDVDANWMEGKNQKGEIGIFPKCYVEECQENGYDSAHHERPIPDRPKTPKFTHFYREESPAPGRKNDHIQDVQAWEQRRSAQGLSGPAHIVPKNAETFRAVYPYSPKNADELELQPNDIVFVVEKCDDGWFIGTLLRTGQFGTFPGNYVERH
ncbi:hypothetical protein L596_005926 [Steinernema carpocapsae]|uniref:Uncharacterized protein n=1 Tax=Steinernema carpocapsae TaxID=34508 RepID=A0A4V6I8U1_STECR|nr:hypothetical protein L596_005926 [Steinernema carpocapsae]